MYIIQLLRLKLSEDFVKSIAIMVQTMDNKVGVKIEDVINPQ